MSSMRRYRLRPRRRLARAWHAAAIAVVVVAFGASASAAGAWGGNGNVNIVRQGKPPAKIPANTHYYKTIQAAVNASKSGDWVLIEPGVYYEEVTVTSAQSGIWIRGMNRNTVIIDGKNKTGNGIEVYKANDVWVENLTVRNFERMKPVKAKKQSCGNEIWWNGGAGSGKIGASGWYGSYLTAYNTDLYGGYGIFTNNETEGSWENIYASGYNDSGMYLGACQECKRAYHGSDDGKQRAGLLGLQLGRQAADRKLGLFDATRPASRRTRKTQATGRRRRTANATGPNSPPRPRRRSPRQKSRGARSSATTSSPKTTTSRFRSTDQRLPRRGESASCFRATTPIWSKVT